LAGWRFLLFALIGAGAIVLLASIGTPGRKESTIDRHTGERLLVVRNVADAVYAARDAGNAQLAAKRIDTYRERFPEQPVLERMAAIFSAELGSPDTPPSSAHPEASIITAEQERARLLRTELERRAGERFNREELTALLADLEADRAVSRATEKFFSPFARWRATHAPGVQRPDELAARTLAKLARPNRRNVPEDYLEVVAAFRSQNRTRARMRWLLRAFAAFPASSVIRDRLMSAYLEYGRALEAFLLLGVALDERPEDLELWRRRAKMAGWLSLPGPEIEAREKLIAHEDSDAARERLIALYREAGRPADAVDHALAIARRSSDPKLRERPARLALEGGRIDEALAILEQFAKSDPNPVPWRERIIEYAWQDLRVERVIAELKRLREIAPGGGYEKRLEGVYRRLGRRAELAQLLDERLQRRFDPKLEEEVLALHSALGHTKRVHEIILRRLDANPQPRLFFADLGTYAAMGIEGLLPRARALSSSILLTEKDVPAVLDSLRPLLDEPGWREVAIAIAMRFASVPEARAFLVDDVDRRATPEERAKAAAALAAKLPQDPAYLEIWIDRATWAGDLAAETRARELQLERTPQDAGNLRRLAALYAAQERPADAAACWATLVRREGLESDATLRLIDALMAAGKLEEAMGWLEKRAALPGATVEDRLEVATGLFDAGHYDRALRFFMAVLDEQPERPGALLRVGQIKLWTNDPRGAIPFLERRLSATDEERASVWFYLGEAHWALREEAAAAGYDRVALQELLAQEERSLTEEIMVARMLAHLGRIEEARPIFERVLAQAPNNVELILDYADSMVAIRDVAKARELVERSRLLAPSGARLQRLDGSVAILEGRYEEAAAILDEAARLHGPDAGAESERGRAHELAGDWDAARDAYRRSLELQPDNRDVAEELQRAIDRAADLLQTRFAYRRTGSDSYLEFWSHGSVRMPDSRTRLAAALGVGVYRGRAAAFEGGTSDLERTVAQLQLSYLHRLKRADTIAGGLVTYPGATGDAALGAWAGLFLQGTDPYRTLELRLHGHLLLDDPTAAVGLGGRSSGLLVRAQHDLGKRFWAGAELEIDALSVDPPGLSKASDTRLRGLATVGWRILEGRQRTPDDLRTDRAALPGLVGTALEDGPGKGAGPLVTAWVTYEGIRMGGSGNLDQLIPIGNRFDYLTAGGRADFALARGLGASLEASLGADLSASQPFFNLNAAAAWRPSSKTELSASIGLGTAQGRDETTTSITGRISFTYRW